MTAIATPPPDAPERVVPPLRLNTANEPLSFVGADLMPDEVRARRRLAYLKRRLVFGLVALALVIGLGDALARQQTSSAEDDLATAQQRITSLNQQTTRFGAVVTVQSQTQQLTTLLTQAMAGDVPWATLTGTLQRLAPRGLTLTGLDGSSGTGSAPVAAAPGASAAPVPIGTLSLTGNADGYRTVADYVSALARVPGLTAVTPATTTATGTGSGLTFTIAASLTSAARSGRYTTATPTATPTAGAATPAGASAPPAGAAAPAEASAPATNANVPVGN